MIYITRIEHFNAAHRLYNPNWSDERNREAFGVCANQNWHGHNFELTVTVKGMPDVDTGLVMDLKLLSKIIKENIIEELDHKNLNLDVGFMKGKFTSCEVLVTSIWSILQSVIEKIAPDVKMHYIKLVETPKNYVEYYGE